MRQYITGVDAGVEEDTADEDDGGTSGDDLLTIVM
jgi:hypothetical protein